VLRAIDRRTVPSARRNAPAIAVRTSWCLCATSTLGAPRRTGRPISQEWLHKRVWSPTLRLIGASHRGQYNIRDTFITLALSAAEDPGWVAKVCGTSEQMIFKHYRSWMPSQKRNDGSRIAAAFDEADPTPSTAQNGHRMGTMVGAGRKTPAVSRGNSGGGGNRTRVRRDSTERSYTLSSRFSSSRRRP